MGVIDSVKSFFIGKQKPIPVDAKMLSTELARGSYLSGVRPVVHPGVSFGLTPERLAQILTSIDRGAAADARAYLTLAEEMEERDLHYASVLSTRKHAIEKLDVIIEDASDDPKDVEIGDAVRTLVKQSAFVQALPDMLDAIGKGYSVIELNWDTTTPKRWPKSYIYRDPRYFRFDLETGQELCLLTDEHPAFGVPLSTWPYKFITHFPKLKSGLKIRGGLARLVAIAYMCKSYTLKDWMAFAEVFGMPLRLGQYGDNATEEQKLALLDAVSNIGTDAAAIIPDTMKLEIVASTTSTGGERLFSGLAAYLDSQVSKGVIGQTMTADSASAGLGSNQADVHNEVRGDIRDSDGNQLAATLQRDLIKPFVDLNYGPQVDDNGLDHYPTIQLKAQKPEDLKLLSESLPAFIDRGLKVQASVIRDKFNLGEPEEGAELLGPLAKATPFGSTPPGDGPPLPGARPGDDNADDPKAVARTHRRAAITLMRRALSGETLTHDQRSVLAMSTAHPDAIDELVSEALKHSKGVMDPIIEPIVHLAQKARSFEEMKHELAKANLGTDALVQAVATLTFKSRGLGDASDTK